MKVRILAALGVALCCVGGAAAQTAEQEAALGRLVVDARPWAADPVVTSAVITQNLETEGLGRGKLEALDSAWRNQLGADTAPMSRDVAENPASAMLAWLRDSSDGVITQITLFDNAGLLVAMSDPAADYWRGDEAVFLEIVGRGPDALFIGSPTRDADAGAERIEASFVVRNSETQTPIGVVILTVDPGRLE